MALIRFRPFSQELSSDLTDIHAQVNRLFDGFLGQPNGSGKIEVSGRLLTIRSVSLTPASSGTPNGKTSGLTGAITAAAYVLPASQSLTGSATPASPTGEGTTSASASSPVSPAIVKVNP